MRVLPMMLLVAACGSSGGGNTTDGNGDHDSNGSGQHDAPPGGPRTVFVIPMENKADSQIYGNTTDAPYINGLFAQAARATMNQDELPNLDSEPHYIWMEAGTNVFTDHTFSNDNDASSSNSTNSTAHLSTQLETAGISWTSYQEGITSNTCPISSSGEYATKHDPFVFFQDVSGSPPSKTNAHCSGHHKSYADFQADLAAGVSGYIFITPNLCHDMHGDLGCPSSLGTAANIQAGDVWLSQELPRIIAYTNAHHALTIVVWDEGDSTNLVPLLVIGPGVKPGADPTVYSHSSMLKSVEEFLGVPVLSSVASANDFAPMFQPGTFP